MDKVDVQAVQMLLTSDEPSLRYRTRTEVLRHQTTEPELVQLQHLIACSERVQTLLSERDGAGRLPWPAYNKWFGAHWVLADLAALAYPLGDRALIPLREQVLDWLLGAEHFARIKTIAGKARRCASQEGNALWYLLRLGLADERCETLARSLVAWQWPDGGWNCDKNPHAQSSSFMETLLPMRGLALFGRQTGATWATRAAREAAEVFLQRRLFRRRRDGEVMNPEFLKLHYPCYWHYDILFGLKVLSEMDLLGDQRCQEAIELLAAKRLPGGGWSAAGKYWGLIPAFAERQYNTSLVGWEPTGARRVNPWVTLEALSVLYRQSDALTLDV